MRARPRLLLLCWLGLLLLLAVEFFVSRIAFPHAWRPLLLLAPVAMTTIVALGFMGLAHGPGAAKIFALAGLFWLMVLLGLGSIDPLTRTLFPVQHSSVP
jgi:cytochrome c oxidase subunit 4